VRWLEDAREEGERRLREGLDGAAGRTDELALRRVWSRVAEPELAAGAGRGRWWIVASVGLGLAGAAAVLVLRPTFGEAPGPAISALPAARPAQAPPEKAPLVDDGSPVVLGPVTVHTGARQRRTLRLQGGARAHLRSRTEFAIDAGQRPALKQGELSFEVPRQKPGEHFSVAAGPYVILVVGTKFDVGMGQGKVRVKVTEGVVEVWREAKVVRLVAGDNWEGVAQTPAAAVGRRTTPIARRAGASPRRVALEGRALAAAPASASAGRPSAAPSMHASPPEGPRPSGLYREAKAAIARGDAEGALSLLGSLSQGTGPAAENAAYDIGRVLRDDLHRPRDAIRAWLRYRTRFPNGLLRVEADISIIEAHMAAGANRSALAEAEAFLQVHPESERRAEVERVAERLRRSLNAAGATLEPGR
jgi:hypothetical protein